MRRRVLACLLGAGLAVAACGASSSGGQHDAAPGLDGPPAQTDGPATDAPAPTDGAPPADAGPKGHAGTGAVVGAVSASSASYKLIGTVTSGRGTGSSTSYKYRGGVVGATQGP